MNEQRIPQVERVIRTYDESLGWGPVTVVETAEREDGNNSFMSITFIFGDNKLKIDSQVAEKLFILVTSLASREAA